MWAAFGLQPHRSETFKLSSDPLFVDKVRDIVGLYLSPPNRALVLSVDEIKQFRGIATRYEKDAANYLAAIKLICVRLWCNA
jgi:transposase